MISDQGAFDCDLIRMQALFSEEGARRAGDALGKCGVRRVKSGVVVRRAN